MSAPRRVVGLVSDTHGLLRPAVPEALAGCDLILHAGDVGDPAIIDELGRLAPVRAIRGNVDTGGWAAALPDTAVVEVAGGTVVYMLHDVARLDIDPAAAGFQVVLCGHSHKPGHRRRDGVLYVNPGSAGPRRFGLPVSVARLLVDEGRLSVEFGELSGDGIHGFEPLAGPGVVRRMPTA